MQSSLGIVSSLCVLSSEDVVLLLLSFDILLVSDVVLVGAVLFIDTDLYSRVLSSVDEVTLLLLVSMALLEHSSLFSESVVLC